MRSLSELIDRQDSAWPLVQEWLAGAAFPVEVLPGDRATGEKTLLGLQVTTRSPLGAIALECGGLLVEHGWLRVLGSGAARMQGSLLTWNGLETGPIAEALRGGLVVAHDVVGGFFALNGGGLLGNSGNVCYLAPDTLQWEDLSIGYSAFLQWAFSDRLSSFYTDLRWPGWEPEVQQLSGDQGFSIYPPQWAREGSPVGMRSRRAVPMTELWNLQHDIAHQLRHLPLGSTVRPEISD
jgi:hypothetical protein